MFQHPTDHKYRGNKVNEIHCAFIGIIVSNVAPSCNHRSCGTIMVCETDTYQMAKSELYRPVEHGIAINVPVS
jgi:hypothetical protein